MKRFTLLLAATLCFFTGANAAEIQWTENYQQALNESKATSKPLFLFFTGTGWCSWCSKLEKEALHTQAFTDATKEKLIFVKLDFPMGNTQSATTKKQNQELQQKFSVKGFPTVVIIDSNEKTLGVTGYRSGGGKQYADHILGMTK